MHKTLNFENPVPWRLTLVIGGIVDGAFYLLPIWFARRLTWRWGIVAVAAVTTGLAILDFFVSPAGAGLVTNLVNRGVVVFVIWATAGAAALESLRREGRGIDLLLSDVVMPGGMSGHQLAEQARALFPDLKVMLISGFSRDQAANGYARTKGFAFLNKPFRKGELARLLRQVLDS